MYNFLMLCQEVFIHKISRTQIASESIDLLPQKLSQLTLLPLTCCVRFIVASHCVGQCWPLMVMILYVEQAPRIV